MTIEELAKLLPAYEIEWVDNRRGFRLLCGGEPTVRVWVESGKKWLVRVTLSMVGERTTVHAPEDLAQALLRAGDAVKTMAAAGVVDGQRVS